MIVAIDGPAASGKGTLARRIAGRLGFAHLDTGQIYRAVAALLLAAGYGPDDTAAAARIAEAMTAADLGRDDLRGEAVGQAASRIAAVPAVRGALLAFQRRFARTPPEGRAGAVLDGRDIGTEVCPEADVKIYVTADLDTRARRRHKELLGRGEASIYARVLCDMRERDARDQARASAPLRPADGAIVVDTTEKDAEQVLEIALAAIEARQAARQAARGS